MWSLRIYQTSLDVVYIMFLDTPQSWADAVNSPAQLAWPPHADFCRALGSRTRYAHHGPHTCDQYPRYHPSPPEQKSHCYQQYVITVLLVVLCHHYTGIITIICRFPSWRVEGCMNLFTLGCIWYATKMQSHCCRWTVLKERIRLNRSVCRQIIRMSQIIPKS